ncbi:polyketide synthase (plasmid) [Gloeocapsa sp. PCC 7428]|uniref:type I polyketide synthase n=1 Tax=Gloeocapsa sp. PCC 7428 TaxID=1173026 RepID=UPI0002A60318|nr:type I polyketide synthase [Gloeocapsa sp. PCC 7428]AFZ33411.1 polyketide synthase [Gloeocapsa sp. PCC 7428]
MNQTNINDNTQQRVLTALKEARAKLEAVEQAKNERIAIIGMAGRFPGARNIDEFWQNICNGKNSIQFLPDEELQANGVDAELNHPNYVKAYASFPDFEYFAADFFGYSPREAEIIEPQHRIFLECAYEALETAGYDPEKYQGDIGVYAGASLNSYIINLYTSALGINNVQAVISNVMGLMPTRVSYKLNLTGPSCGVQTGCSTSLVSVHLACQSLLNRECDMALAGGVSVNASGKSGYVYQADGVLSPDGYCRAFDAQGQGTVFGNGVGIVVLKRLSEALADGDYIYAIIKGSAINNDGASKVGLTAPSVAGQAKVVASAIAKAGINPETIEYIETHGTGTALGDPIEIAALTKAFRQYTQAAQFCAIASVKTNIGHLDAAAGVAGLIKTALAINHGKIPPSLNFESPNPQIDFTDSPFYVNTQLQDWHNTPRRAAVSSFGMGGTNAHVILEAEGRRQEVEGRRQGRNYQLLVVSAKTDAALEVATANLVEYLKQIPDVNLADVAYTLQVGRQHFTERRAVACQDATQVIELLSSADSRHSTQNNLVFMFAGQGSQYLDMAKELYATESLFREHVDRCCEILKPHLGLNLCDVIYSPAAVANINDTLYAQPALFVIEYALAQLWMSWGIQPQAMIGHSIGEYVAATLAGVFALEDALAIVAMRGRLMQQCSPGAMLAVSLTATQVNAYLNQDLTIAAINGDKMCVVSGAIAAIEELQQRLTAEGIGCRRLHTSHAFHSPMMQSVVEPLVAQLHQIQLSAPQIPFISNLTGTWIATSEATDPNYWGNQLRQTVKFGAGIAEIMQLANPIFLEVAPGRTLSSLVKAQFQVDTLVSLHHPQEQQSDIALMLQSLGKLWQAGVEINWQGLYADEKRSRIPLPTYPFERQRYWVERDNKNTIVEHQTDIDDWLYIPAWKRSAPVPGEETGECWLLFIDSAGLGSQLAQHLQQIGHDVVIVKAEREFSDNEQVYAIAPDNATDYTRLLDSLQARKKTPTKIVHLWQLDQDQNDLQLGFYSLLFLVQALDTPIDISVITNELHEVVGTENTEPVGTTILGLCKVIPQEFPQIRCRNIDIERDKTQIRDLIAELTTPAFDNVAYRNHHRWLQTYEKLPKIANKPLRTGGVYLIVGDLVEGLGLVFAQYLAEKYHARLIIVGRADLPEKHDWEKWLATHGRQDTVSDCIRKLQNIEAQSQEMLFFSADLASERICEIVAKADQHFGKIHGVIYAGVMGDRASHLIKSLTPTQIEEQFHSKVYGLIALEQALQGRPIDFYLLQSSLSTVVGGVGFAAYAAANTFMDAFARAHNQHSTKWISVNWDAVKFDDTDIQSNSALLNFAMTPQQVWELTERILSTTGIPQIIATPRDLQNPITEIQPTLPTIEERPATYIPPSNEIEQKVANIMQELLGIQHISIHDNFFELGGHSLLAIQAVSRLREDFQIDLPMREFLFESPTIAGIAKVIDDKLTQKQADMLELLQQIEQEDG